MTNVVLIPIGLLLEILISRGLGVEQRGLYSFALIIYGIILTTSLLGTTHGIRYGLSAKLFKSSEVLFTAILMGCGFSALVSGFIGTLWYFELLGATGNQYTLEQIGIIILGIPPTVFILFFTRIFLGNSEFILNNKIQIVFHLTQLSAIAILLLALKYEFTGAIIGVIFSKYLYLIILLTFIIKKYKIPFSFNIPFLKHSMTYGIKVWLMDIIQVSNKRLDQMIIGFLLMPKALGLFSVAVAISELSQKIPQAVTQVFFNKIAVSDDEKRKDLVERIHRITLWVTTFIGLGLAAVGYWVIILLLGDEFGPAYPIMLIYLPGVLAFMTARILLQYFTAIGEPMKSTYIQGLSLLISIPLYIVLIKLYGLWGGALASSLAYISTYLFCYLFYKHKVKGEPTSMFLLKKEDIQWIQNRVLAIVKK